MADQKRNLSWTGLFGIEKVSVSLKEAFLAQLTKDLNHSFTASGEDIFQEVLQLISRAVETNNLSNILYRVDLSEAKARACMNSPDPIHSLTQSIMEREAQKVIFRRQYSGDR